MKKILAVIAVVAITTTASFAQDVTNFASGTKALLFNVDGFIGNLKANSYSPYGIGMKYYLNSDMAVRGMIRFGMNSEVDPWDAAAMGNQAGTNGTFDETTFGIGADVLMYMMQNNRVKPYMGLGFMFATTSNEKKDKAASGQFQNTTQNGGYTYKNGVNSLFAGTTLGVGLMFGVEYFITKELSLAGEYKLGFASMTAADVTVTTQAATTTTVGGSGSQIGFGQNTMSLLLNVYF